MAMGTLAVVHDNKVYAVTGGALSYDSEVPDVRLDIWENLDVNVRAEGDVKQNLIDAAIRYQKDFYGSTRVFAKNLYTTLEISEYPYDPENGGWNTDTMGNSGEYVYVKNLTDKPVIITVDDRTLSLKPDYTGVTDERGKVSEIFEEEQGNYGKYRHKVLDKTCIFVDEELNFKGFADPVPFEDALKMQEQGYEICDHMGNKLELSEKRENYCFAFKDDIERYALERGMADKRSCLRGRTRDMPTLEIYQLKDLDSLRKYHYTSYERLMNKGLVVEGRNYEKMYEAELKPGKDVLDSIYEEFNVNRPKDFFGHSLSVSDVIVLNHDGISEAFFVDDIGFKKLPAFEPESAKEILISIADNINKNFGHDKETLELPITITLKNDGEFTAGAGAVMNACRKLELTSDKDPVLNINTGKDLMGRSYTNENYLSEIVSMERNGFIIYQTPNRRNQVEMERSRQEMLKRTGADLTR